MALPPEDPKSFIIRVNAAKMGCAMCRAPIRLPVGKGCPAGDPFPAGPYQGRYWCADCWTIYYDEHPQHLADIETRQYVAEEAKAIKLARLRHGAEIIYEQGENRVLLTERGTILFDLPTVVVLQPNEFDPERFIALLKALEAVKGKVPGYEPVTA